jgi:hypothetical protein
MPISALQVSPYLSRCRTVHTTLHSGTSTGAQQLPQGEHYHYSAAARARSDAEVKRIRASASAEAARMRSSFEQASRVYRCAYGSYLPYNRNSLNVQFFMR